MKGAKIRIDIIDDYLRRGAIIDNDNIEILTRWEMINREDIRPWPPFLKKE